MLFRVVATAALAVVCGSFLAEAQSVRQISGPREVPPASFDGQQYVDSRGCVFVRAGLGGTTAWVPRVTNNRKVLCGFPPTFAQVPEAAEPPAVQVAAATAPPVSAPQPVAAQPRVAQPAPTARRVAAPRPAAQPAQVDIAAGPGCPARAPIAQRFALQGGGSAVLCLSREGQVSDRAVTVSPGVAAPVRIASGQATRSELVCPGSAPVAKRFALTDGGTTVLCTRGDGTLDGMTAPYRRAVAEGGVIVAAAAAPATPAAPVAQAPVIPKGYKAAWNDDRLNPNRGRGTAEGQAAQDRVWTRQTPARLVAAPAPAAVRVSTKSAPVGRSFVQVGTFGQPANAEGARARLAALGLPVSGGNLTKGGKALQVVYAGPFADAGQAQAALGAARRAGFSDAFIK